MESRDQRIMTLATTLKSSGIAKTDSQARMMAEEMIGVEEHVQKSYEDEHEKAHEYLQTAKNLRVPRPASASELEAAQSFNEQKNSAKIEPIVTSSSNRPVRNTVNYDSDTIVTSSPINSGNRNSSSSQSSGHDTHNSALEAIKSQIQKEYVTPMEVPRVSVAPVAVVEDSITPPVEPVVDDVKTTLEVPKDLSVTDTALKSTPSVDSAVSKESKLESSESKFENASEVVIDSSKLDAKKLVELMEEDGKLEDHTREIKEPVKNAKPKEEYAENSIDLASVFSFNKK